MIKELVDKLKQTATQEEAFSVSTKLITAIGDKSYPDAEARIIMLKLANDTIEKYIREFNNRESNNRLLDILIILDTF